MSRRFFFIAGEESGCNILLNLLLALKKQHPDAEFYGIGNEKIQQNNFNLLFLSKEISVIGIVDLLLNFVRIVKLLLKTKKAIKEYKPTHIITVDSFGFCYNIAASVWAYREYRAKKLAKVYDLLFCLLPFEAKYFEKYGLKSVFIGNVNIKRIEEEIKNSKTAEKNNSICVTIGSRLSEIMHHKNIIIALIKKLKLYDGSLIFNILATKDTENLVKLEFKDIENVNILADEESKILAKKSAKFAILKSGTNVLECAVYKIPMVIYYKASWFSYLIVRMQIKVKFITLINIVLNKCVVEEFIQHNANADFMYNRILTYLQNDYLVEMQLIGIEKALKKMKLAEDINHIDLMLENINNI